ncbi:MAG: alanine dehydrogenase [Nitrospira sp.]|nr:alanine dehydrogenase [Nitrospira sp.]
MKIGIPKELKDHEYRVALTPEGVDELVRHGHEVWVETDAGRGAGFPDDHYRAVGARSVASADEVFDRAELILKVKEPLVPETAHLQPRHTLFTYLHLAASKPLTKALMKSGSTAIAYETMEDEKGRLPMLLPMSQIAGKLAIQIGAHFLERAQGGNGILLGGVPGAPRGHVVILGAGGVGSAAVEVALGMGARVTVIGNDMTQLQQLHERFGNNLTTLASQRLTIADTVPGADLLIGAVMVRGAKSPVLVSRPMVATMKQGALIMDIAVDQGGCVETTKPPTHTDPIREVDGVRHYGVTNIPAMVPQTATHALTHATLPFIVRLAGMGIEAALWADPGIARGVNVRQGAVTYPAVAEAHGLPCAPPVRKQETEAGSSGRSAVR